MRSSKTTISVLAFVCGGFVAIIGAIAETILVPNDQVTIQEAIDVAMDGDEIVVSPGTYNEAISFIGKAITLRGIPMVVEPGWELTRIDSFPGCTAAHYNPVDGLLYVGRRISTTPNIDDGLYRINQDGTSTKIADGDRVSGVVVDPEDGDIFFAEDWGGNIYRTAFGTFGRELWVSGFHSGDDDPYGMAITPNNHTGSLVGPGDALVVDRGFNGPNEVWSFHVETAEGESPVHSDDGTLIDPFDIAIGLVEVYLVDERDEQFGAIYRLGPGGLLTELFTSEPIADPNGITIDPLTTDLFVLDGGDDRLVRVDAATGVVSDMFTGFRFSQGASGEGAASVDVTPDGSRIFVTDRAAGEIYTFTSVVAINIASSNPPDGAIDARQPSDPDGENAAGWSEITLTFDGDASEVTADDFSALTDPPGGVVEIMDVVVDGSEVTVTFGTIIPVEAWTIVTHIPSGSSVRIGYLPADVNNDKFSSANDVLFLIDVLNGVIDPAPPAYQTDTDRSGATNASDVLRVIDLLNGAGVYDVFNRASLPD